ncbi:MAG: hypothetical protein ACRDJJ_09530, partial [Actinomycetota bacterium]
MRKTIRSGLVAFLVGALCVGLAWAGSGLVPISTEEDPLQSEDLKPGAQTPVGEGASEAVAPTALEPGFYAGAAKVSIEPRPDEYDGTWETDYD